MSVAKLAANLANFGINSPIRIKRFLESRKVYLVRDNHGTIFNKTDKLSLSIGKPSRFFSQVDERRSIIQRLYIIKQALDKFDWKYNTRCSNNLDVPTSFFSAVHLFGTVPWHNVL